MLVDMILNETHNLVQPSAADALHAQMSQQPQTQMQAPVMDFSPFGPPRPAAQDELIAQARFWGITNPEKMDPAELQHRIEQFRNEIPRDQQTSLGSASLATLGLASEAGGAASRIVGNLFGDIKQLPFVGPTLAKILRTEKAKYWLYDLSQKTAEFTEAARAAQPMQDKGAFDVMAASGKVAGNALPALLLWNAVGAAGGWVPPAWAGRVTSPFIRGALQGGLTGGLMEAGSDEPTGSKVFNIGLGMALGGSTAVPYFGASLGLGLVGAGIGSQVGDTPEERKRHAIEGALAGAALGVAPLIARAAFKVKGDIPGPMDREIASQVQSQPYGTSPEQLQLQSRPLRATARMTEQPQETGPDFSFEDTRTSRGAPLQIRAEPTTGEPQIIESPMPQPQPGPGPLPAPAAPRGLLPARIAPTALRNTKVVDESGFPLTVFHGTAVDFEHLDLSKADPDGLFGPGFYHTENPGVAAGYAGDPIGWSDFYDPSMGNPNIRPARLNIQNPFDAEKEMTAVEVSELIDRLEFAMPGYDWQGHKDVLMPWLEQGPQTGQAIYSSLITVLSKEPLQGPLLAPGHPLVDMGIYPSGWGIIEGAPKAIHKSGLNTALERIGYDGITHEGGAITGGVSHRVWIAFRPDQVHSPWDSTPLDFGGAVAQGDALTKQATLLESAGLPESMSRVKIDDTDVIEAAYGANPAGVSIVRGLRANPNTIWRTAKGADIWSREGRAAVTLPDGMAFIERPDGSTDVLVGDSRTVTDALVDDYHRYGVFPGQKVVTGSGIEGEVAGFTAKGLAKVRRGTGGPILTVRPEKLLPSRFGGSVMNAPDLYNAFKSDLLNYMNEEAQKAQMPPVAGIWDPRTESIAMERLSDFMDRNGIYDPGMRQAISDDVEGQWTRELMNLDPEMQQIQENAVHDMYTAHNMSEEDDLHEIPVSLEESAEKRGFIWVTQPGDGGVLRDTVNPGTPDFPMQTDEAAREFLARTDRALPDYTPASDMPLDLAQSLPGDLGQEPRLPTEHLGDSLSESLYQLQREPEIAFLNTEEGQDDLARRLLSTEEGVRSLREMTGLGTGGAGYAGAGPPPPPPPPSPSTGAGFNGQPRLPEDAETLGGQFDKLRRADPEKLHKLTYDFQSLLSSKIRYMRYAMLGLEKRLTDAGVDMGRAWHHYEDLDTARSLAFNEGTPWIHEWGQVMRNFPRRILRDGSLTRIHEIEDPNARMARFWDLQKSHNLSDAQVRSVIKGDEQITDFMHRFFEHLSGDPAWALTAEREIFRYMPHVRARQAQGVPNPYDVGGLSPNAQFFGEFAREGNLQFRIMDARELGNYMVRSAMFKKYEAEPWRNLVEAWQDPRVPQGMQDFMLDWARLVRFGYDPRGELATRGIQSVMSRMFNTPMTPREAQHLLNMPTGAMYMSMLAGRTSIFFRDAIQPLLALAKVRVPFMANTYGKVLKGAGQSLTKSQENEFREMYVRGLAGGWIERENPNIEAASIYEEPGGQRENELLHLTQAQAGNRERMAQVGDITYGLPNWLVRPSQSNISTLKWYGRQGQLHRLIVGESAYQQAMQGLGEYRASGMSALLNREPSMQSYEELADKTFFSSFEPPIQRRLRELVDAGDDNGAAELFAREVSNWSQFRYGRREVPPALRSNIGRMLFMFGNFTGQFLEGMASSLGNGTPYHKARFAMTVGGVSATLYAAKYATGWSFNKWTWVPYGVQFVGGPMVEMASRGVAAVGGLAAQASGRPASPFEREALKEYGQSVSSGQFLPAMAQFFPYAGYVNTMAEYAAAGAGANPTEQALRYTITGDKGSRVDVQRMLEDMARRQGAAIPLGALSPNGGLMPEQQPSRQNYHNPSGFKFPHGGALP